MQVIVWVSGIVQTALYLDFFYNYLNAKRESIDAPVVLDDNPSVECSLEDKVWKTQLFLSAIVMAYSDLDLDSATVAGIGGAAVGLVLIGGAVSGAAMHMARNANMMIEPGTNAAHWRI